MVNCIYVDVVVRSEKMYLDIKLLPWTIIHAEFGEDIQSNKKKFLTRTGICSLSLCDSYMLYWCDIRAKSKDLSNKLSHNKALRG